MSLFTLNSLADLYRRSGNTWGGYSGSSGGADFGWQFITGGIIAFILTILLYIFVFPESRKNTLNAFFTFIRDFFDLKYLIIEKILKFFYVLNTVTIICVGFFMLFGKTVLIGLPLMIIGPFVVRLMYEATMLGIILVKKTIDINNKLEGKENGKGTEDQFSGFPSFKKSAGQASYQQPYGQQTYDQQSFNQGQTSYDQQSFNQGQASYEQPSFEQQPQTSAKVCPNCGAPLEDGAAFCAVCGSKIN